MCLVIAAVFLFLGIQSVLDNDATNGTIYLAIAVLFVILMVRNILKVKKERKAKADD
jgi:uncharacterized membrane protein (DUF2068 family)